MICVFEHPERNGNEFIEKAYQYLSEQRKEKMSAYRMESDRINSCAVYILLRYALFREYGITEAPVFVFGDHEKPFLRDHPEIHFNLSHCKTAVCCIVSDSSTAIDINEARSVSDGVIRRVCSEKEQKEISLSADPLLCFMGYWTRKECYSKLTGEGMSMDFSKITDELPEYGNIRTIAADDYVMSYYSLKEEQIVKADRNIIFDALKNLHF